jgi:hypothetical protein
MSFSAVGKVAGAAFVIGAGAGLVAAAATWPSHAMQLFHAGTAAGVAAIIATRVVLTRVPTPRPSRFDVSMLVIPIIAQIVAMSALLPRLHGDLRQIWLAVLTIGGLHFLPMAWPLGRWVAWLGMACLGVAALGYALPLIPIQALVALDGGLKIAAGLLAAAHFWPRPAVAVA